MFYLPQEYTYIFLCLPFLIVWLILYIANKTTRFEQLTMSYIGAIAGPLSEIIYFNDYWLPKSIFSVYIGHFPFMLEDLIFGFAIGGIGAVIYEVLFHTKQKNIYKKSKDLLNSWTLLLIFCLCMFIFLIYGVNSIYASSFSFVITSLCILFKRKDLFLNAFYSGISVMLVIGISYYILFNLASNTEILFKEQWLIYGTTLGTRIFGIPLTEIVWGFTWGFIAGPWYEFRNNKLNIT